MGLRTARCSPCRVRDTGRKTQNDNPPHVTVGRCASVGCITTARVRSTFTEHATASRERPADVPIASSDRTACTCDRNSVEHSVRWLVSLATCGVFSGAIQVVWCNDERATRPCVRVRISHQIKEWSHGLIQCLAAELYGFWSILAPARLKVLLGCV